MDVAVDQARHQGALAAIDDLRLGRLDRLGRHFLDRVALDQHLVAAARLVPARVEQVQILEKYLRHQRSPNMGCAPYDGRRFDATVERGWRELVRRVVVIGTTGSGKSTLAERLAAQTGLRVIELDALFWGRDWQPAPLELFRHRVERETAGRRLDRGRQLRPGARHRLAQRRHADLARPAVAAGDVAPGAPHGPAGGHQRGALGHRQSRDLPQFLPQPPVDPVVGAEDPSPQSAEVRGRVRRSRQGEACRYACRTSARSSASSRRRRRSPCRSIPSPASTATPAAIRCGWCRAARPCSRAPP